MVYLRFSDAGAFFQTRANLRFHVTLALYPRLSVTYFYRVDN